MKNETEFAEYEIYDYPQENSHITGLFKKTIEPLLECLPYPKLILKMYAHFREHKAKNRNVHNPAGYYAVIDNEQYLSALDNNYTAVYNQVYKAVSENEFEVFEFMKSFYAFCSGSADNSGVENGFILKYFLKSVQEKDHLPGKSGNVIVCDPSPKFIEAMLKESWFKHKAALYFTDPLNASVYFYEKELMNYDIWYENSFPKRNHTVCILIFGDSLTPTEIVSELKKLNEKTEEAKEVHVYL